MKHTIKLLTLAAILTAVFGLTGCPGPVNNYIEPVHEHVWTEVTTEYVAPTCTTKGSKTYVCTLCGETKVEELDALGHNFSEWSWTTTIEVAYDHDGEKEHTRTCTRCGYSERETVVTSRFVAGGYDGTIPTDVENPETYRYQYNNYQIYAYVYSSVEDALNNRNARVLYFSFPNDTTGFSQIVTINGFLTITIDNLLQMKNGYVGKTVKYFAYDSPTLLEYIGNGRTYNSSEEVELLTDLDSNSPIYIVIE